MAGSPVDPELDALLQEYLRRIGARMADIRALQGLTLSELEELSAIDSSTLSRIERGKLNVSVRMLVRVAEGLGVRLHELVIPPEQSQIRAKTKAKKKAAGRRGH